MALNKQIPKREEPDFMSKARCSKMSEMSAEMLFRENYHQISRKWHVVARVDLDAEEFKLWAEQLYGKQAVEFSNPSNLQDYYRRYISKDTLVVPMATLNKLNHLHRDNQQSGHY